MKFWRVDEVEHERGWGSRVDDTTYYHESEKDKADAHVKRINSHNTAPSAPDYYVTADISAFSVPDEVVKMIVEHNKNLQKALHQP